MSAKHHSLELSCTRVTDGCILQGCALASPTSAEERSKPVGSVKLTDQRALKAVHGVKRGHEGLP